MEDSSSFAFTCTICGLAFSDSAVQRSHFNEDLHRYNAKRRAVDLPAVSAAVFAAKVVSRQDTKSANQKQKCDVCSKTFASENAFTDHLHSRKHKEAIKHPRPPPRERIETDDSVSLPLPSDEQALQAWLSEVARIQRLACLFCTLTCSTFDEKLAHMQSQHGFFVPDQEYLVDAEGLIGRAAEEIGLFNTCLYCGSGFAAIEDGRSGQTAEVRRIQRGLDAVRKHMNAKGHCKLRWDTEADRLQWSDYYDYSASYVDDGVTDEADGEWEDVDDMLVDQEGEDVERTASLHQASIRFGDSEYELVLPSGARLGHRALRNIYRQNLVPYMHEESRQARAAKRLAELDSRKQDASAALVPLRGQEVVRAKSSGDARYAQKATRQFLGTKAREAHKTRVAIRVGNQQKHFRDQLLQ